MNEADREIIIAESLKTADGRLKLGAAQVMPMRDALNKSFLRKHLKCIEIPHEILNSSSPSSIEEECLTIKNYKLETDRFVHFNEMSSHFHIPSMTLHTNRDMISSIFKNAFDDAINNWIHEENMIFFDFLHFIKCENVEELSYKEINNLCGNVKQNENVFFVTHPNTFKRNKKFFDELKEEVCLFSECKLDHIYMLPQYLGRIYEQTPLTILPADNNASIGYSIFDFKGLALFTGSCFGLHIDNYIKLAKEHNKYKFIKR